MKDYTNGDPAFSESIHVLETSDTNHADNVNTATKQLLDNTVVNHEEIEKAKEKLDAHNHDEKYYTKSTVDSKLSGKADRNHAHSDYAAKEHAHADYATKEHAHTNYAVKEHGHDNYLKKNSVNAGKISSDTGFEIHSDTVISDGSESKTVESAGITLNAANKYLEIYGPTVISNYSSAKDSLSLRLYACSAQLLPYQKYSTTEKIALGSTSCYFDTIYYNTKGTPSDRNLKKNISVLSDKRYMDLFDKLLISMFQYKGSNPGMTEPDHSRYHLGVIAQDLQDTISECGIDDMEFSPIKATFFVPNTSENRISGGWRTAYTDEKTGITYDYSKNVWDYKHDRGYQVLNEVIEKSISELQFSEYRENIQYLMIEDNAKVSKEHYHPPVKINSIHLVDREGNITSLPLDLGGVAYYEQDDTEKANPLSGGIYDAEEDSVTVTFDKMYGAYLLKISEQGIRLKDYESIIIDVDFIGEYKMYFLPACEMVNANVWDRKRNPKLIYDYAVDYEQLYLTAMYALQETRKEFEQYKSDMEKTLGGLDHRIIKLEGGK